MGLTAMGLTAMGLTAMGLTAMGDRGSFWPLFDLAPSVSA